MELSEAPWQGVLWQGKMLPHGQRLATKLLLYMIGVDLSVVRSSIASLSKEYAEALNTQPREGILPPRVAR